MEQKSVLRFQGKTVKVLNPPELIEEIKAEIKEMQEIYFVFGGIAGIGLLGGLAVLADKIEQRINKKSLEAGIEDPTRVRKNFLKNLRGKQYFDKNLQEPRVFNRGESGK